MKTLIHSVFYFMLSVNTAVYAEAVTDGTVGAVKNLSGQMEIPQDLGRLVGNNLFHSFKTFNIPHNESATFTSNGTDVIDNVISRVTGGQVSMIDGLLQSTIGTANFYFINPAGVTLGANASIDVPAAFHLSTAGTVQFASASPWSATNTTASSLTSEAPEAFGFLNNSVGDIKIQGSQLQFKEASAVSLSGRNIVIDNGMLSNPAGQIRLYGIGNKAVEIGLNTPPAFALSGKITISGNSLLDVGGFTNSGQILMRSASLDIKDSTLTLDNFSEIDAGLDLGLSIVTNDMLIDNSGLSNTGKLSANTFSQGKGTIVDITANNKLSIINYGKIETGSYSDGDAGAINLNVKQLELRNGGRIMTSANGLGKSGAIFINATDSLLIDGQGTATYDTETGISSHLGDKGDSHPINIKTANLQLVNNGFITTETLFDGNLGEININANNILVDNAADITSKASCNEGCTATGNASKITINSDNLTVQGNGQIISSAFSQGKAGDIVINAHNIVIDGQSLTEGENGGIAAQAAEGSSGQAGNITLNTDNLSVMNNGVISISTFAHVSAEQLNKITPAKLSINAYNLELRDEGNLYAASTGNVPASPIAIKADLIKMDNASISTDAKNANGGAITLNGIKTLIQNAQITTSVENQGNGGDIAINNNLLILDGGFIRANTGGVGDSGGDININVNTLIASHNQLQIGGKQRLNFNPDFNVIQAASPSGINGSINIRTPSFDISSSISGLSSESVSLPAIEDNACAIGELNSSLIWGGKGGMPVNETTSFIPPAAK